MPAYHWLKDETLEALNRMDTEAAERAAQAIVAHWHGLAFGIEACPMPPSTWIGDGGEVFTYVNAGDVYDVTLVCVRGVWDVSSMGDTLEALEEDYMNESGELRCGYCGEWFTADDPCHPDA